MVNIRKILVSQPKPAIVEKSPFFEVSQTHKIEIEYKPLIRVVGVTLKEFRSQRVEILDHTAVIFTSRTTVDSFFHVCEEARIVIPEGMKYICQTEAVALYLQKYIVYRKRKISFGDGTFKNLVEVIVKHKNEKFLLTQTEPHKPELQEMLDQLKLTYSPVIMARTISSDMEGVQIADMGLVALYSPSDVKAIVEKFDVDSLPPIAVFGNATLAAALEAGLKVKAMAPNPKAPSMVKAVDNYLKQIAAGEEVADVELKEDLSKEEFIKSQQNKILKKSRVTKK